MNIFSTDLDPVISAKNLDDLRVNKMIIESASLLANAIAFHGGSEADLPISKISGKPFKTKAWQNHPSCIWVKENQSNYMWLLDHTVALIDEIKARRGTDHCMVSNIDRFNRGANLLPAGALTDFANCTPYKQIEDAVLAYRMAMIYKWEHDAKVPVWTNSTPPDWYTQDLISSVSKTEGEFEWTGIRLSRSKR